MKNQSRIPGVDTFRFFAFMNVFLFHATSQWSAGYLGVQGFFVLSAFLLTFLALNEIKETGSFSKLNFFLRRSLRIYPLYFLVVALSFFVVPVLAKAFHHQVSLPEDQWKYWLFLSNLDSSEHLFALKFLWSVSVEEQFYLFFILMSFMLRRHVYLLVIILVLMSAAAPFISNVSGVATYYNPLSYCQDFAIGILAAKLYFERPRWLPQRLIRLVLILSGVITICCFYIRPLEFISGISFACFAGSLILFTINCFSKESKRKWLPSITESFGRYTYGLYVYSGFVITFAGMFFAGWNSFFVFVIELLTLSVVAIASYRLFEKKFLDIKSMARVRTTVNDSKQPEPIPTLELAPIRIA